MRVTTVLPGESLVHVAARTQGGSSYQGVAALPAYIQALVMINSQARPQPSPLQPVVDWSALAPGQLLALPS
jgi:hypothetical protein